ncbi:glycosylphosphatidylinositol anchor biosynthesis [Vermiconidia calcicola]|uniref:Glycosylphosphatidylinositol anchor biosynthesis n=1 Tax=Vermiconidia calcicola TaxID=1690605 RepID=A0ACC3MKA5_9PEZI|nr:glycosylphosphatidylinositol anchor biosynthesis [Vermiconidia calcicola]
MPPHDNSSTERSPRTDLIHGDRRSSRQANQQHLRPEDAFYAHSPPRKHSLGRNDNATATGTGTERETRSGREKRRNRSSSRRRRSGNTVAKGQWKKLLWVKQSYPDNYTDEETFLDHLQRNPRLRPYEFWPLVADSTIIVQHERVSPQTVVWWATIGTVAGWVLKEYWQSRDEAQAAEVQKQQDGVPGDQSSLSPASETAEFGMPFAEHHVPLATTPTEQQLSPATAPNGYLSRSHSRNPSVTSAGGSSMAPSPTVPNEDMAADLTLPSVPSHFPPWHDRPSSLSPRMQERLATVKSAVLIYCSLLGLSPILKSLTLSTSSDSIWALSSWLMVLNVMTFDYGAGPEAKFPAPLSTNAALMASTVLASRLPSTTHVFSLTLFSIEVFGLFPVFRRHLRHQSWTGHLWLTTFLVVVASGGLSMTISGGGYILGIVGVVLGGIITGLSMGMTSWWLIGLQRYKNEIHGPWDPARPVIRRHWD